LAGQAEGLFVEEGEDLDDEDGRQLGPVAEQHLLLGIDLVPARNRGTTPIELGPKEIDKKKKNEEERRRSRRRL
jgi:hypothetical protein